jgi:DNA-binding NarL/FixJ family response regulator
MKMESDQRARITDLFPGVDPEDDWTEPSINVEAAPEWLPMFRALAIRLASERGQSDEAGQLEALRDVLDVALPRLTPYSSARVRQLLATWRSFDQSPTMEAAESRRDVIRALVANGCTLEGIVWVLDCTPSDVTTLFAPKLPPRVVCRIIDSGASVRICADKLGVSERTVQRIRSAIAA